MTVNDWSALTNTITINEKPTYSLFFRSYIFLITSMTKRIHSCRCSHLLFTSNSWPIHIFKHIFCVFVRCVFYLILCECEFMFFFFPARLILSIILYISFVFFSFCVETIIFGLETSSQSSPHRFVINQRTFFEKKKINKDELTNGKQRLKEAVYFFTLCHSSWLCLLASFCRKEEEQN